MLISVTPCSHQTAPNQVNISLFPSASGNLSVLAAGSVNNNGQGFMITVSEANPSLVPNAFTLAERTGVQRPGGTAAFVAAAPGRYAADHDCAGSGDIGTSTMVFPKEADVIAAGNISELVYSGKNLSSSDVTVIAAGGDISYSTPTQPVTNYLIQNIDGIQVAGPGYVEVLAGGSINLGDGSGILDRQPYRSSATLQRRVDHRRSGLGHQCERYAAPAGLSGLHQCLSRPGLEWIAERLRVKPHRRCGATLPLDRCESQLRTGAQGL